MPDTLTTYLFVAITEKFESLTQYDERLEMKEHVTGILLNPDMGEFKVYCGDFILRNINGDKTSPFFESVMTSINFHNLKGYLMNWLEDADVGEDESKTEYDPVPVPEKFKQGQAEIDAKFEEMKALIKTKEEAYATLAKIVSELNDLSKC